MICLILKCSYHLHDSFFRSKEETDMIVADKNLVVLPDVCSNCDDCFMVECQLCKPCYTEETRLTLVQSYWEHQNKMDYLRVFPPAIVSRC